MYSYGSPHMAAQKQDDQLERIFSSYVRIQDVVLKTYLGRWTIGRSGERRSGLSVLPVRYDDDDDISQDSISIRWSIFACRYTLALNMWLENFEMFLISLFLHEHIMSGSKIPFLYMFIGLSQKTRLQGKSHAAFSVSLLKTSYVMAN